MKPELLIYKAGERARPEPIRLELERRGDDIMLHIVNQLGEHMMMGQLMKFYINAENELACKRMTGVSRKLQVCRTLNGCIAIMDE